MMSPVQRARKPNYTREETETLLDQLIHYGHFLFNKHQPVNNQQKADVWASIAMQVNAVPNSAGRTVDELKHRWQDMAQKARHTSRKNSLQMTSNGSKTPLKPVPFLHKILQILGESHGKDTKGYQQDETLNVNSTPYSSDSSNIKEEIEGNNQSATSAADLCQSNESSTSSGTKRSRSFAKFQTEKANGDASSASATVPSDLNHASSAPHDVNSNNNNGNSNPNAYQQRFESKRRRMKKSSHPRKSVSSSSYHLHGFDGHNDDHDTPRIQHKHIETFRSMVLDPESEIVMEVEEDIMGVEGDAASRSSSVSASNLSTAHKSHFDFNYCGEDRGGNQYLGSQHHHRQQQLKDEEEGSTLCNQKRNLLPITGNSHSAIFKNNKQPSCLPTGPVNYKRNCKKNNFSALPQFYHDDLGFPPNPQGHPSKGQKLQEQQYLSLESMSKSELDRRCVISQIQMQDQRTRYLLLKEQKIQLDIELLSGKCVCKNLNLLTSSKRNNSLQMSTDNVHTNAFQIPTCHLSAQQEAQLAMGEQATDAVQHAGYSPGHIAQERNSKNSDDGFGMMPSEEVEIGDDHSIIDDGDDDDEVCDDEENESLMVSFGDDNNKIGDDSVNLSNGDGDCLLNSEQKTGEDWEKHLQENIGL